MKTLEIIEYLNLQWPPAVQTLDGKAIKFDITKQSLEMSFIANQNFCHSVDVVQGGYISAMLDAVMAYTVIGLPDVRKMVSTLELKTSYISIGHPGLMIGKGMITKIGKSIVFLNGELFQNNNLIATATSTAKILYKK